jgi:two-component system sensor histidine kinase RegB
VVLLLRKAAEALMDAPLLALTRKPARRCHRREGGGRKYAPADPAALDRGGGQTVTILVRSISRLRVPLPLVLMLGHGAAASAANLLATLALPRHHVHDAEMMLALLLDMGALTLQLYFSGGATNPVHLALSAAGRARCDPAGAGIGRVLVAATALSYALLSVRYRR